MLSARGYRSLRPPSRGRDATRGGAGRDDGRRRKDDERPAAQPVQGGVAQCVPAAYSALWPLSEKCSNLGAKNDNKVN